MLQDVSLGNRSKDTIRRRNVLYVGQLLTDRIARERGLEAQNVAGSNRMARLARAMQVAGAQVNLVSAATSMRQRWTGSLCHRSRVLRVEGIPVLFAWSFGVPVIRSLVEPVAVLVGVLAVCKKHRPDIVVVYNYYPANLLAGVVAKWRYRAKMILEVEDVIVLRKSDWCFGGDARTIPVLILSLMLKLGVAACDRVLVPARKFLRTGRIAKKHIVVAGCISVESCEPRKDPGPDSAVRVLVSGFLAEEQGLPLVLGAVETLAVIRPPERTVEFVLCGFAEDEASLRCRVDDMQSRGVRIAYEGIASRTRYLELLKAANVCVAMQDPDGRFGDAKTPSKVYEYLAYGKVVVASNVGDLSELPKEIITICDYRLDVLVDRLWQIANNWEHWKQMGVLAAEFALREFSLRVTGERIIRSVCTE